MTVTWHSPQRSATDAPVLPTRHDEFGHCQNILNLSEYLRSSHLEPQADDDLGIRYGPTWAGHRDDGTGY